MLDRPVMRGRIFTGTSSKRKRRRWSTTSASISGYSSGKLRLKTARALRFTPTNPEVGSRTGLPRMGRRTMRKNRIPRPRTTPVDEPFSSMNRDPMTISQPALFNRSRMAGMSRASCCPSPSSGRLPGEREHTGNSYGRSPAGTASVRYCTTDRLSPPGRKGHGSKSTMAWPAIGYNWLWLQMRSLPDCPVPHLTLLFFGATEDVSETAKMVPAGTACLHFRHASQRPNRACTDRYLRGRIYFRDRGRHHHAIFQECIDMLFHFSRKPRHRTQQLFAVRPEQYFSEYRKRRPAAGLSRPERTVVVKAYE